MASLNKKPKLSTNSSSRGFQKWWGNEYAMSEKGDKAFCNLCFSSVVCRTSSVKRHYETKHKSLLSQTRGKQKDYIAKAMNNKPTKQPVEVINTTKQSVPDSTNLTSTQIKTKSVANSSNLTIASYITSSVIAKHGKPFSHGEYIKEAWLQSSPFLFQDFENREEIIQRIKDMPIARNTVKERILKMGENVTYQQKIDIKSSSLVSLCVDQSTDITGSARLAVFIRYLKKNEIREELIHLASISATSGEAEFCEAVLNALLKMEIEASKVVSISSDGVLHMLNHETGFMDELKKHIGHSVLEFDCILNQQTMFSRNAFTFIENIMNVIMKIINYIYTNELNKEKFEDLLNEIESMVYNGLFICNDIRWLSRSKVLERFIESLDEIRLYFREENKIHEFEELFDLGWSSNLMFFADFSSHLNEFIHKLQDINITIITMLDLIKSFVAKLKIFHRDINILKFKYFPNLQIFFENLGSNEKPDITKFTNVIHLILSELSNRFEEFQKFEETFKFIIYPDSIKLDKLNLNIFNWLDFENFEMQLIEFQSNTIWKEKFCELRRELENIERNRLMEINSVTNANNEILSTWNAIPENFSCLKKMALAILTLFSSTNASESLFSDMCCMKSNFRNRLRDQYNAACTLLKVTKYEPDVKLLASIKQQQKSH